MSAQFNHMTDELLVRFLLGETSETEARGVLDWMAASKENEKYFESFRTIWEEAGGMMQFPRVDENAAWERLKSRIEIREKGEGRKGEKGNKGDKGDEGYKGNKGYKGNEGKEGYKAQEGTMDTRGTGKLVSMGDSWWKMAAALLAIILTGTLSLLIYRQWLNTGQIELAANLNPVAQTLPDGSVVTLNKESVLSYPSRFNKKKRTVELKGEAFFDIKPNREQPFEIRVNRITVTVLGTSFNIRETADATEIIVETGLVRVEGPDRSVELKAGERIRIVAGHPDWEKETESDKLYQYYRSRSFQCDNTPLWKLAKVLSEAYDVQIEIPQESLRNIPLTTVFEDQPLDEILSIIAQTLDIHVRREGTVIYLED